MATYLRLKSRIRFSGILQMELLLWFLKMMEDPRPPDPYHELISLHPLHLLIWHIWLINPVEVLTLLLQLCPQATQCFWNVSGGVQTNMTAVPLTQPPRWCASAVKFLPACHLFMLVFLSLFWHKKKTTPKINNCLLTGDFPHKLIAACHERTFKNSGHL